MDDDQTQAWFEAALSRAKSAAEAARGQRGEQSSSTGSAAAESELPDWELRGVEMELTLGFDANCRMLGAALAEAERRHMLHGTVWIEARSASGALLGVGAGHLEAFVLEAEPMGRVAPLIEQARSDLAAKLLASPAFSAAEQAAAIAKAAREPDADARARSARL